LVETFCNKTHQV